MHRPQHKAGVHGKYQICCRFEITIVVSVVSGSMVDFPSFNVVFAIKLAYDYEACNNVHCWGVSTL